MSFSMKKFNVMENSQVLLKIFKRTFLIFMIGYLMYWFPFFRHNEQGNIIAAPFSYTRILGVLQRIALCFGIASLMIRYLSTRVVIWTSVVFLLGYWAVLMIFGAPGEELTMTGNAGMLMEITGLIFPGTNFYHWVNAGFFQMVAPGAVGSLLFALSFMLFCWLIGYVLDKKKIYIRV